MIHISTETDVTLFCMRIRTYVCEFRLLGNINAELAAYIAQWGRADQVWWLWDRGVIDDELVAIAWLLLAM